MSVHIFRFQDSVRPYIILYTPASKEACSNILLYGGVVIAVPLGKSRTATTAPSSRQNHDVRCTVLPQIWKLRRAAQMSTMNANILASTSATPGAAMSTVTTNAVLGVLLLVVLRALYVIRNSQQPARRRAPRGLVRRGTSSTQMDSSASSANGPVSVAAFLGSGGHTSEMFALLASLPAERYAPRTYVVGERDQFSAGRALELERAMDVDSTRIGRAPGAVVRVPRAREVHQPLYTVPFSASKTFWVLLRWVVLEPAVARRPCAELLLMNGPGTCVPLCAAVWFARVRELVLRRGFAEHCADTTCSSWVSRRRGWSMSSHLHASRGCRSPRGFCVHSSIGMSCLLFAVLPPYWLRSRVLCSHISLLCSSHCGRPPLTHPGSSCSGRSS